MGMTARGLEITVQAVAWAVLATSFVAMVAGGIWVLVDSRRRDFRRDMDD